MGGELGKCSVTVKLFSCYLNLLIYTSVVFNLINFRFIFLFPNGVGLKLLLCEYEGLYDL